MFKFTKQLFGLMMLIVLTATSTSFGQTQILSLDDAIKIALENSSEKKMAELDIKQAKAQVNQAYGHALPTVDFSAQVSHFFEKPQIPFMDFEALLNNATYGVLFQEGVLEYDQSKMQEMGTELMSMSQANNLAVELQASQILFNSAVLQGIGSAKIYYDMSKYMLEQQAAETVTSVSKVFYACLLAKEMLALSEESLNIYERNYQTVNAMYKEGFVSEYDMLTAKVQYENFKPTVSQAKTGLIQALNGLKAVIGIQQSESIDVEGKLSYNDDDKVASDALINSAMENNYTLGTLEYKQQVDDAFVKLEESDFWPTVAAFGSYSYNGMSDDWNMTTYNQALAGVSFSMNLFKGMRTSNKVQEKKVERMKTDETLRMAKIGIEMEIRNTIETLQDIKANIKSSEENIQLATKGYEIAQERYKQGDGTQVEVINAEMQLRAAKTNVLRYYFEYMSAIQDLNFITGDIDDKYLDEYKVENYNSMD
jgi:OMF family outer membrane factor